MDENKSIEIPFGAKDSELKGWEYTIPEGMEAEIKDGKIIVREKENEDEKIRKELLDYLMKFIPHHDSDLVRKSKVWIAWLEKQGEQKLFNNDKYQTVSVKTLDRLYESEKELERLKQNEQNPTWSKEEEEMLRRCISATFDHGYLKECDWLKSLKNLVQPQPKPEWSKDDEERLNEVIETLNIVQANRRHTSRTHYSEDAIKKDIEWLKSRRIGARPQPKSEWSEEDEKKFIQAYAFIENTKLKDVDDIKASLFAWLKFLKERYTWKPSDEQLEALEHSLGDYNIRIFEDRFEILTSLYDGLKKLKG